MHHQINQMMTKAIQCFQAGNLNEAEPLLLDVLKKQSKNFDALHILGVINGIKNQHKEALEFFRKALKIDPNNSFLNFNIAKAFSEIDEDEKALKYHLFATKLNPKKLDGWLNFGRSLSKLNKFEDSLECYYKALALNPEYAEAWTNLGCAFIELENFEQALDSFDKSLKINPQSPEVWSNRGNALFELKQYTQALESFDTAIRIKPDYADAWYNRGNALLRLNQYEHALESYDKTISLKPEYIEAWSSRGSLLCSICQFESSEASYREAIRINPQYLEAHSNLLFSLNYFDYLSFEELLAEAKRYGEKASQKSTPKFTKWNTIAKTSTEKIKIGFVSGDLKNHPVGYFTEGLVEQLNPDQFEIYGFPTHSNSDELTDRIKPLFHEWIPINRMSDHAAAKLIHEKGIHVLVDLSGHTAHNKLLVFAYKPAPVQISWLGYFATTGLPEMDYFLGDPHMSPLNEMGYFTETLWNLPETWLCLKPPTHIIKPSKLPALKNGFITFGSFSNLSKLNDKVVETWSTLLNQVPTSKLLLKSKQFSDPALIDGVKKWFLKFDISADRLILEGPDPREAYYEAYHRVDFILDTFPYPGGTTSVDSLWMGVPVLTLKGDRFLSRLGQSIASNSGNYDWIANDVNDYINKAVKFSSNLEKLEHLRSTLKDQVIKTPLFDTARFAKNFGDTLLSMLHQHNKALLNQK
jgi:protein O-GlcNAc transferase